MIKPRLAKLQGTCAQQHVSWKRVQAGANRVNVIVLGQRSLTCVVWMWQKEGSGLDWLSSRNAQILDGSYTPSWNLNIWRPSKFEGICRYWIVSWIAADWLKCKEKRGDRQKYSTQLKFTRSFPAQGLSKLNKTTQAATYQTACMPGRFYLPLMFVSVTERSHSP